jgi:hypothetical protein
MVPIVSVAAFVVPAEASAVSCIPGSAGSPSSVQAVSWNARKREKIRTAHPEEEVVEKRASEFTGRRERNDRMVRSVIVFGLEK